IRFSGAIFLPWTPVARTKFMAIAASGESNERPMMILGPISAVSGSAASHSRTLLTFVRPFYSQDAALTLCAGLLLILGLASWQRTWAYESEETLWTDTLTKNPISWLGHNNLGLAFLRNEQRDGARMHFQKALEINPNYVEARSNLGLVLFQEGQLDEAVAQYQKALEIDPNSLVTHANLGNALFKKRQLREAIAQYQKASELDPNSFAIRYNLGVAL